MSDTGTIDDNAAAYGEGVWFWHPMLVSSLRRLVRLNRVGQTVNPKATVTTAVTGEITSYKP